MCCEMRVSDSPKYTYTDVRVVIGSSPAGLVLLVLRYHTQEAINLQVMGK